MRLTPNNSSMLLLIIKTLFPPPQTHTPPSTAYAPKKNKFFFFCVSWARLASSRTFLSHAKEIFLSFFYHVTDIFAKCSSAPVNHPRSSLSLPLPLFVRLLPPISPPPLYLFVVRKSVSVERTHGSCTLCARFFPFSAPSLPSCRLL